jgi:hypothetical protein
MASITALNTKFLTVLSENLEFDEGEMNGLLASLCAIAEQEMAPLNARIAELESGAGPNGKVKVKASRKGSSNTGAKKQPNAYSRFVRWASEACKGDAAETDITFTPCQLTADKAISRWSAAPDDLVDFTAEYKLEDLIKIVKGHDDFSNLMIASSLVWNMIPPAAKEQVTAVLA